MAKAYKLLEKGVKVGSVLTANSDHLPDLSPDKQKAEAVIRDGDSRGHLRARSVYAFEELSVAAALLDKIGKKIFTKYLSREQIWFTGRI